MAELSTGIGEEQVAAMIANALSSAPTSFVASGASMTISDLMANFPAGASYAGRYARVSNLYNNTSMTAAGGVDDIVRCRFDATNNAYRWVPQREAFNVSIAPASGTTTLVPLVTPPTIRLTGTLLGNLTLTPSSTNAYVGQVFEVIQNSTLGLFTTSVTGLIGSNLTLLGNTTQQFEFTSSGWVKGTP